MCAEFSLESDKQRTEEADKDNVNPAKQVMKL
jgi:hypothetical protein